MELRLPRAGAELRCLCVGVLTLLGLFLWTAGAGAQVYPATETVQLASWGGPPDDGLLHVGPRTIDGPLYRALVRFDVPAFDSERLLRATLELHGGSCYLGESPLVAARPVLTEWGPDSNWDDQPETGAGIAVGSGGVCPDRDERIDVTALVRRLVDGRGREPRPRTAWRRVIRRSARVRDAGRARGRARSALRSRRHLPRDRIGDRAGPARRRGRSGHSSPVSSWTNSGCRLRTASCPSRRRWTPRPPWTRPSWPRLRPIRRGRSCCASLRSIPRSQRSPRQTTDGSTSTPRSSRATASSPGRSPGRPSAAPGRRAKPGSRSSSIPRRRSGRMRRAFARGSPRSILHTRARSASSRRPSWARPTSTWSSARRTPGKTRR